MTSDEVRELLRGVKYPGFSRDIVSFGLVRDIDLDDEATRIRLTIVTGNEEVVERIVTDVEAAVDGVEGLAGPEIIVERSEAGRRGDSAIAAPQRTRRRIEGVACTVAVASGKGGVGKSTVAANLAVALARRGRRVGIVDADIYGPSIPTLFAVDQGERLVEAPDGRLVPLDRAGVKLLSMGMFVDRGTPLIWRGPMLTKALGQFLGGVDWGRLDFLIIDLPPGTGDVQLTLTQQWDIDAAVIVTTPQDVALADVERGLRMFEEAAVPVAGVVENMSSHLCPGCGRRSHLFGEGGGRGVAEDFAVPFLGEIPLMTALRISGDQGRPMTASEPDGEVARAFDTVVDGLLEVVVTEESPGA